MAEGIVKRCMVAIDCTKRPANEAAIGWNWRRCVCRKKKKSDRLVLVLRRDTILAVDCRGGECVGSCGVGLLASVLSRPGRLGVRRMTGFLQQWMACLLRKRNKKKVSNMFEQSQSAVVGSM